MCGGGRRDSSIVMIYHVNTPLLPTITVLQHSTYSPLDRQNIAITKILINLLLFPDSFHSMCYSIMPGTHCTLHTDVLL